MADRRRDCDHRLVTDTAVDRRPLDLAPYHAVLLLSFGGPEGPEDVLPYLENVTRGRGIPQARLAEVATHYLAFGGRSPINDQNRALLAALGRELAERGSDVPVLWGNRNWAPFLVDTLREAHEAGARRVLTVVTSAYSSYSGCRQYREDIAAALATLAAEGRRLTVDKVRNYADHPGFVEPVADAVRREAELLPEGARLVFVTHSVPVAMNDTSGPEGGAYLAQHRAVSRWVAERVGRSSGRTPEWDLVFCSRSGPPGQPWLEPDVNDHLAALAAAGVSHVVLVPIGFVSDHMEVVHDLDVEAMATAASLGVTARRTATVGTHPRFVSALADLLAERAATERGESPDRPAVGGLPPLADRCPRDCCRNLRGDRPAACGEDRAGAGPRT